MLWFYRIYQLRLNSRLKNKRYQLHSNIVDVNDTQPYIIRIVVDDLINEGKNLYKVSAV